MAHNNPQVPPAEQAVEVPPPPPTAHAPPAGPVPEPFPIPEEVLDDWRWAWEMRQKTDLFEPYRGQHVAVVGKKILGASRDTQLLEQVLVEKHQLDPQRIVWVYIDPW
jgi:hypothetical protein